MVIISKNTIYVFSMFSSVIRIKVFTVLMCSRGVCN